MSHEDFRPEFLFLADQIADYMKADLTWEEKRDSIFGERASLFELVKHCDPDTEYKDELLAFAETVEERAEAMQRTLPTEEVESPKLYVWVLPRSVMFAFASSVEEARKVILHRFRTTGYPEDHFPTGLERPPTIHSGSTGFYFYRSFFCRSLER